MNARPRIRLIASLAALFLIGGIIGLLTGYNLATSRPAKLPASNDFKEEWLELYKTELHLSTEQTESIRPLLEEPTDKLGGLWYRTLMTSGAIKENVDRQIEPLLTPGQRQNLLALIQKNRAKRLAAAFKRITGSPEPTGLHYYAAIGDTNNLLRLLQNGQDPNGLDIAFGLTPLAAAAAHNSLPGAQCLLAHGANPNAANADRNTPLHTAAFFGHTQMIQFLLQNGANPQALNSEGKTPLEGIEAPWITVEFIAALLQVQVHPDTTPANRKEATLILQNLPTP